MDKKFEQFTILMMDIGEGKVQFRNYLEHQAQQEAEKWLMKQRTKYIYQHLNASLDPMQVCHFMQNQTISIIQTSSIYHMTSSKRRHTSML